MSTTPAGWYPDPHVPGQQRYFDGASWTDETVTGGTPVGPGAGGGGPNPYGGGTTVREGDRTRTPDGQLLAGWWRRVAANLVDGLVMIPVNLALAWPFWSNIFSVYGDYLDEVVEASDAGRPAPPTTDLMSDIGGDLLLVSVIGAAAYFVYYVGFLGWKQATPGKLVMGTRVRLRERPGPMPTSTILLRWLTSSAPSLIGSVPLIGLLANLYVLLDSLWPLWDQNRQALHDKAAKTNVVMKQR
ncbi:RDD family protein [Nocardioides sp. C4-1]|uniref:RDD family protein n=1 Tax=Nocardioides sp. C4-1 TaxID=3151851 RepID=UPI003264815B